jgi:hypothetical protein
MPAALSALACPGLGYSPEFAAVQAGLLVADFQGRFNIRCLLLVRGDSVFQIFEYPRLDTLPVIRETLPLPLDSRDG